MDSIEPMRRAETEGWDVVEDAGRGRRRVVPSPLTLKTSSARWQ
jgi:carbamate kinase